MAEGEKEVTVSLMDIAGLNVTDIKEVRFEVLPIMVGMFNIKSAKLEIIAERPSAVIICTVKSVENVVNYTGDREELIGKEHREAFMFSKAEDVGRLKAFCVDLGAEFQAGSVVTVPQLLEGITGIDFPGKIKHRTDKNDKERIYANVEPVKKKPGQ